MNPNEPPPSHHEIAERAHALWQQAGCPDGYDLEFWLRGEKALRIERSQAHHVRSGLAPAGGPPSAESGLPETTASLPLLPPSSA
jgi:hypothetical protein